MTKTKRNKLRRWITRIILFILLLPLGTLVIVRSAGLFRMRKSNADIQAFLAQHNVNGTFDTLTFHTWPIIMLKTNDSEKKKEDACLFVHGSPGSMDAYLDYMVDSALLQKTDLITFDRPGLGNSRFGTSMPSLTMQTQTLNAVMEHYKYKRYWLVGHSYGAPIIVQAAMQYPHRIAGLCLVAGSVSPALEPKARWRKWLDLPLIRNLLPTSMRVSNEELMPLKQDLTMIEDDWDRIKVPVSLIHGTKDVLVPFENLEFTKEKLVNADTVLTRVMEGKSHFILWSDKPVIVEELLKLISIQK